MKNKSESTVYLMKRLWCGYMVDHLGKLFWGGFFMIVVAMGAVGQAYIIKPALDYIIDGGSDALKFLIPVAIVLIGFARGCASYMQSVLMAKVSMGVVNKIQKQMFGNLVRADLGFLYQDASGIKLSRFLADAMFLRDTLSKAFTGLARDLVMVVGLVGYLFYLDWLLALAVFVAFPVTVLPIVQLGKRMRKVSRQTQTQLGEMTAMLDENFKAVRQVKSYAMEEWEEKRADKDFDYVKKLFVKMVEVRSRNYPILETMASVALAAVISYGGWRVSSGEITVGSLSSFILALGMAFQPIRSLATLNSSMQQGLAAAIRIFELLDTPPAIVDKTSATVLMVPNGRIEFKAVDFSYTEKEVVLNKLELDIRAGSKVAFVGRSGAGKSSLLNLLLRFYEPQSGQLLIDGVDIQDVTLKSLRQNIGLVSQDTILLNDTIAANIRYGCIDANDDEVLGAAKKARVDEFASHMSDGYDTMVGEQGILLSGGQKQRIAIARAILKNAPILLLDEATSALDSKSEKAVQSALDELMVGRTTIIISHRLATVVNADHIYMMADGKITAEGTHQELQSDNAAYQDLHQI